MKASSLALFCLVLGCTRTVEPPAGAAPFVQAYGAPVLTYRAQGERVLDVSPRGEAVVGRDIAALPDSDQDPSVRARWLTANGAVRFAYADTPVLSMHLRRNRAGAVVLTTDHTLVRLDAPDAQPVVLDREAYGPVSFDAADGRAVYTHGEPPFVQLRVVDLDRGTTESPAESLASTWCPTLSADGREVLTMASPDGHPAWFRVRAGSAPEPWPAQRTATLPFANGPSAPIVWGDLLVIENESGTHALSLEGALVRSWEGLHHPSLSADRTRLVMARDADHITAVAASSVETGR